MSLGSSLTIQGGVITTSGAAAAPPVVTPPVQPPASSAVSTNASTYVAGSGVTSITLTGSAQTVTGNAQGDTFYSNDTTNHLIGGAGNDTFYMGRGGDVVTGGGGADTFIYNQNPWNSSEIKDFTSQDKIDFTPTLARAGYHGSDPIGAGFMKVTTDSAGEAQIWLDPNDTYGASGWWLAVTLDGVAASSLTIQGGVITTSGAAPPPVVTPVVTITSANYTAPAGVTEIHLSGLGETVIGNDQGDAFYSNNSANHLIGGAGADTFYIGRGGDTVTGGGGADAFVFMESPYAAGHITDFNPWQDHIDLTGILHRAGYFGSDPMGAGFIRLDDDANGNGRLWIDPQGGYGAKGWSLATTLDGVSSAYLHQHGDWLSA